MVSSFLLTFSGHSGLEVELRLSVFESFSLVVLLRSLFEVLLHKVDIVFVILGVDSWILPNEDSVFVQGLGHFLALNFPVVRVFVKECFHVNDWNTVENFHLILYSCEIRIRDLIIISTIKYELDVIV